MAWDGLAANRIFFWPWSSPCDQLPNRGDVEIEYYVNVNGCGGVSCQWFGVAVFDHAGRRDYAYAYVRFLTRHINSGPATYHHVINHETGHILGLADGDGSCPDSIMHSRFYGCAVDREWPSAGDRASAENEAFSF